MVGTQTPSVTNHTQEGHQKHKVAKVLDATSGTAGHCVLHW